jgi:hypothetical protein
MKNSKKLSKNAEFHADFESVEKVLKKCTKTKLLAKTFTHFRQTCFASNFFWWIFSQLFQRIRNLREILRFLTPFSIYKKKKIYAILVLFSNFEAKCAKNGSKNQKTYFVNVS